jgi:UDPglucose 6-dehydrogenase
MEEAKRILGDKIEYASDQYDALIDSDCLLMITEWPEFKFPNFNVMRKLLKNPVIFDGRNIYDIREIKKKNFDYFCIGVRTSK